MRSILKFAIFLEILATTMTIHTGWRVVMNTHSGESSAGIDMNKAVHVSQASRITGHHRKIPRDLRAGPFEVLPP